LPTATAGYPYSTNFVAIALGAPPVTVTPSGLPAGLTMANNGTISGTPGASGSFTPSVAVKDANNATANGSYTLTVNTQLKITTTTLAAATATGPYSVTLAGTGGAGSANYV